MPETIVAAAASETKTLQLRKYYDPPYTTAEELDKYQDMVDKVFKRKEKSSREKENTLHRVIAIMPEYTDVTGDDKVNVYNLVTGEQKGEGYNYIVRVSVESYQEERVREASTRNTRKIPLGSFTCTAREFCEKFIPA